MMVCIDRESFNTFDMTADGTTPDGRIVTLKVKSTGPYIRFYNVTDGHWEFDWTWKDSPEELD